MRPFPIATHPASGAVYRDGISLTALIFAGLLVGILDFAACSLYWAMHGVPPVRIAQSLAAMVVGVDAYTYNMAWVVLGLLVEAIIGIVMVAGYVQVASFYPKLLAQPRRYGLLYGAVTFAAFEWIVLPLSATPPRSPASDWQAILLLIYMVVLGIPSALLAKRLLRSTSHT